MKPLLSLTLSLAFILGSPLPALQLPKDSYNLAQLPQAQENALKKQQALAFLITEKKGVAT